MSNESRSENSGLSFVLKWGFLTATGRIVAIMLGSLFAAPLTVAIADFFNQPNTSYTRPIINNGFRGLLIALAIGFVQWLLLRKRLQGAIGWLITLIVGETLGLAFIASFIKFFIDTYVLHPGILVPLIVSPLIGLLIAITQGNILHKNNYQRKQWLITVPIVWAITQYFNPAELFSLLGSPYLADTARSNLLITGIIFLLIGALLQGTIEGFAITWVFRHPNKMS